MANKLIKKDLLHALQSTGLSAMQAEAALDAQLTLLADSFQQCRKVEIRGFGSFTPKIRLGGKKRNPRTGEAVYTSDALVVRFKLSKDIRKI